MLLPTPLPGVEVYSLNLTPGRPYTIAPAFSQKAVLPCGKIYMLTGPEGDATVHYVGQTARSIADRIHEGLTQPKGYRWAAQAGDYRLLVWVLEDPPYASLDLESIEAELVFAVRVAQKAWPKWQTGIKFRHIVDRYGRQFAPRVAIEMLRQYYEQQLRRPTSESDSLRGERDQAISILSGRIFPGS